MAAVKGESSDLSPLLFLKAKGEPMRFFIRPGPTKVQLQPLIRNGGGIVCRTQEPNLILLADPGEINDSVDSDGRFYISTQYIRDCVAQNQQLDMNSYRLMPAVQTRAASRKQRGSGRMGYSHEDDSAILEFISKRRQEAKGNRVWQEMEQKRVTFHSWQSMKDRFLKHLQFKKTNKSPEKRKKTLPFLESSSADENIKNPSQKNKMKKIAQVASSSDSDEMHISPDVQDSRTEGTPAEQSEPCALSKGVDREVNEDKPDQETLQEKENQQQEQLEQQQCQDNAQPEVSFNSNKIAGMDKDDAVEGRSEGPDNQQADIRQKNVTSKPRRGRKLGILERAAREFEDSQITDDSESQNGRPPSRASSDNSDTDEVQITAARERAVREQQANAEQNSNTEQNPTEAQSSRPTPGAVNDGPGPSSATVPVTSNAHNFIFDQESQEDLSQSSQMEPVPQEFLEAKEHVVKLMQDCKKDLVEVMKALLKASGDVALARSFLLEGYEAGVHGPIWTRRDDEILLSAGSSELEHLHKKYGEDRVLKRADFLKAK